MPSRARHGSSRNCTCRSARSRPRISSARFGLGWCCPGGWNAKAPGHGSIRPFIEGTPLDGMIAERTALRSERLSPSRSTRSERSTRSTSLGLVHGAVKPVERDPRSGDGSRLAGGSERERARQGRRTELRDGAPRLVPLTGGIGRLRGPVGLASDLYSLGAVLYGCLTGTPLHAAEDAGALLRSQLFASPTSVRAHGMSVPRVLDEILDRLLRSDPRERYSSAAAALGDLLETERRLRLGETDPPLVVGMHDVRTTPTDAGLVGRTHELGELDDLLADARQGRRKPHPARGVVRERQEPHPGRDRRPMQRNDGDLILRAEARELEAPRPFGLLDGLASSLLEAAAADPIYAERLARTTGRWGPELRTVLPSLTELLAIAEQEGAGRVGGKPDPGRAEGSVRGPWMGRPSGDPSPGRLPMGRRTLAQGRRPMGGGPARWVRERGGGAPPGGDRPKVIRCRAGRTRAPWSSVHSTPRPRATS